MKKYNPMAAQEYVKYYAPTGEIYDAKVLYIKDNKSALIEYEGQEELVALTEIEPK